jgi:hypothetical protein
MWKVTTTLLNGTRITAFGRTKGEAESKTEETIRFLPEPRVILDTEIILLTDG